MVSRFSQNLYVDVDEAERMSQKNAAQRLTLTGIFLRPGNDVRRRAAKAKFGDC